MSRFAIDSLAVLSLFLTLVKCVNVINCESAIIWHNIQVAGRPMDHHVWYYRINLPVVIMWWRSEGRMVTLLATWGESQNGPFENSLVITYYWRYPLTLCYNV